MIILTTCNLVTAMHLVISRVTVNNDSAVIDQIAVGAFIRTLRCYTADDASQWLQR